MFKKTFSTLFLSLLLTVSFFSTQAQTDTPSAPVPEVIDAGNLPRLHSVQTLDFASLPDDVQIDSGWFTLSTDGALIAVVRNDGGLVIYSAETGEVVDTFALRGENDQAATVLDARFSTDGHQLVSINTDGEHFYVVLHTVAGETLRLDYPADAGTPVRVWLDTGQQPYVWLEALPADGSTMQVIRLPLPAASDQTLLRLPSAPEADQDAYVRIGRIPAPLAITATADGRVKLWDLPTGELLHTVQLSVPPVFGRINETTGRQLAWRDPESSTLNLLDFETGQNIEIADLAGAYIQAVMVSAGGDVILAVHPGEDAIVSAWVVDSGERIDLGAYRDCGRVPDMVQLSSDGTTLVIGCDTGLDVWRIPS